MAKRKFTVTYNGGESFHGKHSFVKGVAIEMGEDDAQYYLPRQHHGFYVTEIRQAAPPAPPASATVAAVEEEPETLEEADIAPNEAPPEEPELEELKTEAPPEPAHVAAKPKAKPGPKPKAKTPPKAE